MINYLKNYYYNLTSLDGKRGCFSIILIATILTLFEIAFFYLNIAPSINTTFNDGIEKIAKNINLMYTDIQNKSIKKNKSNIYVYSILSQLFSNNKVNGIIQMLKSREKTLVDSNNRYVAFTGLIIMILLIVLLFYIKNTIKSDRNLGYESGNPLQNSRYIKSRGTDIGLNVPIWTAMFSVIIIIGFQIMFYFFGLQYKFLGTGKNNEYSQSELIDFIITKIQT